MGTNIHTARAAFLAKHTGYATYQDPSRESDAGRVLTAITAHPGLPMWALARATKITAERVKHACKYLRTRGKAFSHRTEYWCPKTGTEKLFMCWFLGRKPTTAHLVDSSRCQVAMGFGRVCGTRYVDHVNSFGRVTWSCPACERRNAGLCRTCPRPTPEHGSDGPRPWYCESCETTRRRERNNTRQRTDEERAKRRERERRRIERCKAEGKPYRYDRPAHGAAA
ncbi:hypothetical protein [Gemmatimonas sp.]|uniref:hypothetical protein n=1 Tax=Gemmatimonas sp. TaxID=1962908 RepID=UPI0033412701